MTAADDEDLSLDAFLGGRVHLWQPKQGYRAGIDAVLLAAAVPAEAGESVLELGCGVGVASLCLNVRVPGLRLSGVELQEAQAALARRNGQGVFDVHIGDITRMPDALRQQQFDHVIANPPYFDRAASRPSANPTREAAHGEGAPLAKWVRTAAKRLLPKGQAHFIHRAERLPELLAALPRDLGSVQVLPLAARTGRDPDRVILRARKNGRGAFRLHAPLILHEGARHEADGDSYTATIRAVLREGAPLLF